MAGATTLSEGFAQKVVVCRAYGAVLYCDNYPGLTPWAKC